MTQLETSIPSSTTTTTTTTTTGFLTSFSKPPTAILIHMLAPKVGALYASGIILVHWLSEVPVRYTFIAGALGFVLLFFILGMIINGRLLGFFSLAQHRVSPDWLPILLILPIGFSIFGCFALGLVDQQIQHQLTSGLTQPLLMVIIAVLIPLLLGRVPAWSVAEKPWVKFCEGSYIVTTVIAAIILFCVINLALPNTAVSNNSPATTSPLSSIHATGFICNPNTPSADLTDEDNEDNKCEPSVSKNAAANAEAAVTTMNAAVPPVKQVYLLWGSGFLLLGGAILLVGRVIGMRGAASVASSSAGLAAAVTPASSSVTELPAELRSGPPLTSPDNEDTKQLRESLLVLHDRISKYEQIVTQLQASAMIPNDAHPQIATSALTDRVSLVSSPADTAAMPESRATTVPAIVSKTGVETVAPAKPFVNAPRRSVLVSKHENQRKKY